MPWLQPIPDAMFAAEHGDPAAVVLHRGSIRLAFVAAVQLLPPRQRAVLILRDVLDWSAAEVAHAAVMEMPPFRSWFLGRENYSRFMDWVFATRGPHWRLLRRGANGQPAFAAYARGEGGEYELHTLQVFAMISKGISRNTVFRDDAVFALFGLPPTLDAEYEREHE